MYKCYDIVDLFKTILTPSVTQSGRFFCYPSFTEHVVCSHSLFPHFRLGAGPLFYAVVDNAFPQLFCF